MYTAMPLLRARYPVLEGRLTPYVGGTSWGVAGALGVGLEYFVANNIAIGIETNTSSRAPRSCGSMAVSNL